MSKLSDMDYAGYNTVPEILEFFTTLEIGAFVDCVYEDDFILWLKDKIAEDRISQIENVLNDNLDSEPLRENIYNILNVASDEQSNTVEESSNHQIEVEFIPTIQQRGDVNLDSLAFDVNGYSFKMVRIRGGKFLMGATYSQGDFYDNIETPVHWVQLSDYYIGAVPVTSRLWYEIMHDRRPKAPLLSSPVDRVAWNDICAEGGFITRLNLALKSNLPRGFVFSVPTEAQWEFAARGGTMSKGFRYSGSDIPTEVASIPNDRPYNVAQYKPNELGIYDMSGNVYEWCKDWYGPYHDEDSIQKNPNGAENGLYRIIRGGGRRLDFSDGRVSFRRYAPPDVFVEGVGFRLALSRNR